MKIQIDTTLKIIRVEEKVNAFDFLLGIKKLLPNGEWKKYDIEQTSVFNYSYPYIPTYPADAPIITCDTNTTNT